MKRQPHLNLKMRTILIDWLVQVHQRFTLTQETLFLTISYIDRYLTVRTDEWVNEWMNEWMDEWMDE